MTADTLESAVAALDAGLCPIPARIDGTKVPQGQWKKWQSTRPDRSDVESWFGTGHAGLGIVCGQVSGGLEMFEFEGRAIDDGLLDEWKAAVREAGVYDLWAHIVRGYAERTPSGGVHVLYRCEQVDGNLKLARRPATPAELDENPADRIKVLIETRGEGGFTIVAPSNGTTHPTGKPWALTHGGFDTIVTISAAQRDALHAVARSFDQVDDEIPDRPEPAGEPGDGGTLPGFDLTAADVLEAAGFVQHSTSVKGVHWTRPGKPVREGHSVTVWHTDGRVTPYSSAIDAPAEFLTMKRRLSPWQLHVALNYAGDFAAAARAWRAAHPRTPDTDTSWIGTAPPAGVNPETGEIAAPGKPAGRRLRLTCAADIPTRRTIWLWAGRLALGTLGLLAGAEGLGKSTLAYWVAARITRGDLPGEYHGTPRGVLICATEDSWSHTIKPRLMAAGADLHRCFRIDVEIADDIHVGLNLPADIQATEDAARQCDAALLILDPLMSRLDGSLDTHKDGDVRRALEPLVSIADNAGMAIIGLIHHNKSGSTDPLQLVMASKAFTAVARSVHTVLKDPDDETGLRKLFGTPKNNLGRTDLPVLSFTIGGWSFTADDGTTGWTGKLEWGDDVDGTIGDALARGNVDAEQKTAIGEAVEWLSDYLQAFGPRVLSSDAKREGAKQGHSERNLQRAVKRLGLTVASEGFPRVTFWSDDKPSPPVATTSRGECVTVVTGVTGGTDMQVSASCDSGDSGAAPGEPVATDAPPVDALVCIRCGGAPDHPTSTHAPRPGRRDEEF